MAAWEAIRARGAGRYNLPGFLPITVLIGEYFELTPVEVHFLAPEEKQRRYFPAWHGEPRVRPAPFKTGR